MSERADFRSLEAYALAHADPAEGDLPSGQAELYDLWLSRYLR